MVLVESEVHFIGTESNRDDSPPPLSPEHEARVLTRVFTKALRDEESAVADIATIDRSRAESEYLLALYTRLSEEKQVPFSDDIEQLGVRLEELHSARETALERMDRARILAVWLRDQGVKAPSKGGLISRIGGSTAKSKRGLSVLKTPLLALLGVALIVIVFMVLPRLSEGDGKSRTSATVASSTASLEYDLIGSHGDVDVVLVDPDINLVALGRRLDRDYADRTRIQVYVFNERAAAEYLHGNYALDTSGYSTAQRDAEYAKYYPRWIATYFRDVNNGLNQMEIYKDPRHDVIRTVRLGSPTVSDSEQEGGAR